MSAVRKPEPTLDVPEATRRYQDAQTAAKKARENAENLGQHLADLGATPGPDVVPERRRAAHESEEAAKAAADYVEVETRARRVLDEAVRAANAERHASEQSELGRREDAQRDDAERRAVVFLESLGVLDVLRSKLDGGGSPRASIYGICEAVNAKLRKQYPDVHTVRLEQNFATGLLVDRGPTVCHVRQVELRLFIPVVDTK